MNEAVTAPTGLLLVLAIAYVVSQLCYTLTFVIEAYFFTLPVDRVDMREKIGEPEREWPYVVLFYPVLRELETTMRTTFLSLSKLDYPVERYRVIAIPNANDLGTVESLKRLSAEFAFLEILEVPATSDPSWQIVWDAWDANPKAYWWHQGSQARVKDLPPKKTRQLIYAFYQKEATLRHETDLVINYIDADSCPPTDHFRSAAIGLKHYDVLQAQNVAGNLNASMAASLHAFDHMAWDGYKYPHFSAHGRQPYWVLGKGLFFRARDLVALGGFHPWITIEDPEIGLRFWKNGKRLGIVASSLIEEVPETFGEGINQRKRWVCGFFQTLTGPLSALEFTPWQKFKAWLIFYPCLSLTINLFGLPLGAWALWTFFAHDSVVPNWAIYLAFFNIVAFCWLMIALYANTWKRTTMVLARTQDRLWYMLRVNPIFAIAWWMWWIVPLVIGFRMYVRGDGLVWERTEKTDANNALIRVRVNDALLPTPHDSESKI